METLVGQYQHAASSQVDAAVLTLDMERDLLTVSHQSSSSVIEQAVYSDCQISPRLPSIPMILSLPDGAHFTPNDVNFCWPNTRKSSSFLYWLERKWAYGLLAIGFMVAFLYVMMQVAVPAVSEQVAHQLPDSVSEKMGEETLALVDRLHFHETELPPETQTTIRANWQRLLTRFDLPTERYKLVFRTWDMGPNAMALADGTVVVMDDLVDLVDGDYRLLDAILLHEIGHVHHRHNEQVVIRSTIITVLYTLIFADIEGMGETVLGAGLGLTNAAFSRDMEREADQFAYQHLEALGRSPEDFADALRKLKEAYPTSKEDSEVWNYLSTHPNVQERIDARPQD